jgi:hypothetical protein
MRTLKPLHLRVLRCVLTPPRPPPPSPCLPVLCSNLRPQFSCYTQREVTRVNTGCQTAARDKPITTAVSTCIAFFNALAILSSVIVLTTSLLDVYLSLVSLPDQALSLIVTCSIRQLLNLRM